MFGNLITNRQLKQLMDAKEIEISPFDSKSLKTTHYTLRPGRILKRSSDGSWDYCHHFQTKQQSFILEANDYVVVEVREAVKIKGEGIVGRFIPPSNLIEAGLCLIAGQIDNKYGEKGEALRFGLKNFLAVSNEIKPTMRLAHVEFFDLRGIAPDKVVLTGEEIDIRVRRSQKADDDGVEYPQE